MPPSGRSKKSKPSKRIRKISSSSLSPSNIGSLTSSKLDKSANKFKINVLEPIETGNRKSLPKHLKTLSTADIKELNSPTEKGDDESSPLKEDVISNKSRGSVSGERAMHLYRNNDNTLPGLMKDKVLSKLEISVQKFA